jgi:glycosyltransferase involved in cell wall biosynthesis
MIEISVIVPMYNAASSIERCIAPLCAMLRCGEVKEIIVVDDCSTDRCPDIVKAIPSVRLERTPTRTGPGAARNHAAAVASGTHLWFVDSDVIVARDCARVLARTFTETGAGAVFGCYDDRPAAANFLSQYKNLVHRYYHSGGRSAASTFWAGCGAVERALFEELGGFDVARYAYPSIEDIELGYRIADRGRQIVLRQDLQGKHLKEWRLKNLLYTEVFARAIPWSRLMLKRKHLTDDLNVSLGERARALLALVCLLALLAWAVGVIPSSLLVAAIAGTALANLKLVRFFHAQRGPLFAARAVLYHQFYYIYSSAAFAYAALEHLVFCSSAVTSSSNPRPSR